MKEEEDSFYFVISYILRYQAF